MRASYLLIVGMCVLFSCTPMPKNVTDTSDALPMYPDYQEITVPYNMAPLNFLVRDEAVDALEVRVGDQLTVNTKGNKVAFPLDQWHALLEQSKGKTLTVAVTARKDGRWLRYPSFTWTVSEDAIDPFLTYRLIEPGYEVWSRLQIEERNLETFETRALAHHEQLNNQCMNCHIHGGQHGEVSLFHLRGENGGTMLSRNGTLRKLTLRNSQMISGAVYGDIHPSGRYGVFSANEIIPGFHTQGSRRLEVYDTKSDLCIADFDQNRMILSPLVADSTRLETFPAFSADGRWVYYCGAEQVHQPDSTKQLRYSLCRIAFDPERGEWGNEVDTLWNARTEGGSVCFPKASPDGKYLLFTRSDYGTFPIWHREADLYLLDLQTLQATTLDTANSDRSDTYHSWSHNSRWFAFASKRGDGQYGRVYFSHVDAEGRVSKAFVLPQENPAHDDWNLKSYNIPDLGPYPAAFTAEQVQSLFTSAPAEPLQ